MAETQKIEEQITKFYEAFNDLLPEEKIYFLAEIDKTLKVKSEKERKLYISLMRSAREGKTCQDAIMELKRA